MRGAGCIWERGREVMEAVLRGRGSVWSLGFSALGRCF